MSTTTTSTVEKTQQPTVVVHDPQVSGKLDGLPCDRLYGDFRDDLVRDGFAVIRGAITRERAEKYADLMFSDLEEFGLGFDPNNPSTIHVDHLPYINEKGMCFGYGPAHEQVV